MLSAWRYLNVEIRGLQQPAHFRADKIERDGGAYIVKLGDKQVGWVDSNQVVGWWIEGDDDGGGEPTSSKTNTYKGKPHGFSLT